MNRIHTEPTIKTPEILFDVENNQFFIKGRSLPENAKTFYRQYIDWLSRMLKNNHIETDFVFDLIYFNSASTKMVLDILLILREANENGHKVNVIWKYEPDDEDLMSAGKEFEEMINMPIALEISDH